MSLKQQPPRNGYNAARMVADCWGLHPNWASDRSATWDAPLTRYQWLEIQGAVYAWLERSPHKAPTLGQLLQHCNAERISASAEAHLELDGCRACEGTGHLMATQHRYSFSDGEVLSVRNTLVACDCPRGELLAAQSGLKPWRLALQQYGAPKDARIFIVGTPHRLIAEDTAESSPWFSAPSPEEETGNIDPDARRRWRAGHMSGSARAMIKSAGTSSPEMPTEEYIKLIDDRGY